MRGIGRQRSGEDVQLPSTVTKLGTSLANVDVTDLETRNKMS